MSETVLLYALSTLAQTCAALAAFVGAVGIFRLQTLRAQRGEAEREFRALSGRIIHRDVLLTPINEFLQGIDRLRQERGERDPNVQAAVKACERWQAVVPRIRSSRRALVVFEVWNLSVIAAALIGFNYVASWAGGSWMSGALWAVAMLTAFITVGCVIVWTQGVEG